MGQKCLIGSVILNLVSPKKSVAKGLIVVMCVLYGFLGQVQFIKFTYPSERQCSSVQASVWCKSGKVVRAIAIPASKLAILIRRAKGTTESLNLT